MGPPCREHRADARCSKFIGGSEYVDRVSLLLQEYYHKGGNKIEIATEQERSKSNTKLLQGTKNSKFLTDFSALHTSIYTHDYSKAC